MMAPMANPAPSPMVICDPHHHLWERPGHTYLMDELRADTSTVDRIEKTVFIECQSGYRTDGPEAFRPVGETDYVVAADPSGFVAGIIGYADLRLPEVDDVLAAHIEAGRGRFRGIRVITTWDASPLVQTSSRTPPPFLLGDPAFRSGFAALGRAGLSFEAWLYHPQITELADLCRAHPEVPVVLDHLGAPLGVGPYRDHHEQVMADWRAALVDLASCPNALVKLGGIGMPVFGLDWHDRPAGLATAEELADAWGPSIRWVIDQFGVERCMFESNFPVDKVSATYATLWAAFQLMAADASPADKQALFHDTATRTYRI
jgi:L-fuconolactonase